MYFFSDQISAVGIVCCIFLLTNEVQCRRGHGSSAPKNLKASTSKENIRLVDGNKPCRGYLQIKPSDSWIYVCHSRFNEKSAFVTCRELECGFPKENYDSFDQFADIAWSNAAYFCNGQEQHLSDCRAASLTTNVCRPTYLECSEKPKKPELSIYSWKGSDGYSMASVFEGHSHVVECRIDSPFKVHSFVLRVSMDYGNNTEWSQPAVDNAAYFFLPIRRKNGDFSCTCQYNFEFQPETFSDIYWGSVDFKESLYVRLVGGESRCMGNLELENFEEWRAVSQQHWGLKEAAVVCRQLHCGSVVSTESQSRELQPVWSFYSDCDGSEKALLACGSVRKGESVSTVHVLCSDILHPATISVTSGKNSSGENPMVVYSPYSLFINCSVLPQFPGGHFSLVFTGVKHALIQNQTAVNHSTVFFFNVAEKAHSGNYSCIYHNTVSGYDFSSQSQDITIVVEDAKDVRLDSGAAQDDGTVCSGTLLVKEWSQTMMVSAETRHWDMRHATIVCRQLGCGPALSTSKTKIPKVTPMWHFFSDCDGSEAALLQCGNVQKWFSSEAIVVVCKG